jgi:hypothetical protein
MNKHLLVYDPKSKQVKWRVKMEDGTENTDQEVAEKLCVKNPTLLDNPV